MRCRSRQQKSTSTIDSATRPRGIPTRTLVEIGPIICGEGGLWRLGRPMGRHVGSHHGVLDALLYPLLISGDEEAARSGVFVLQRAHVDRRPAKHGAHEIVQAPG